MIVCPNCNHQNPDGAVQCEACYTPLPALANCPSCGASVQSDASFCGQCGFDLRTVSAATPQPSSPEPDIELTSPGMDTDEGSEPNTSETDDVEIPDLIPPDPLVEVGPVGQTAATSSPSSPSPSMSIPAPLEETSSEPAAAAASASTPTSSEGGATQLQINHARLLHVQTNTLVELPPQLTVLHVGKPNDRIPPSIDVSGFPNSEIVSRVHANIRVEGDAYYVEDVGSSNGTYINNLPLPPGNRHRLRAGDRIALGKGDKVTFIFQSG